MSEGKNLRVTMRAPRCRHDTDDSTEYFLKKSDEISMYVKMLWHCVN